MMKIKLLAAGLVLAMAFTFSCSGDDGKEDGGSSSSTEGGGQVGSSSSSGGGGNGNSITYGNDTYPIVVIGTQTWLAKNLNYVVEGSKCFGEGGEVVIEIDGHESSKTLSNTEVQANCVKYGRLYDWATAMGFPSSCNENSCSSQIQSKHKGICPSGWHIPSNDEWDILMNYVGGYETAGAKLKATSDWNDYKGKSGNGTDDYGFSAMPGGRGHSDGTFGSVGDQGRWLSASEIEDNTAYRRSIYYDRENATLGDLDKSGLYSVRCVKD
jgi:uncharacterized protein (TIGR02145 family)